MVDRLSLLPYLDVLRFAVGPSAVSQVPETADLDTNLPLLYDWKEGMKVIELFTCECCGGTFPRAWSDAERLAEYEKTFTAEQRAGEETVTVCDDCYRELMKKYEAWKI